MQFLRLLTTRVEAITQDAEAGGCISNIDALNIRLETQIQGMTDAESQGGLVAQLCKNEACNVRLHQYCLEKKFSQQRVEKVCPGCGTQWLGSKVIAEALAEETSMRMCRPKTHKIVIVLRRDSWRRRD
ncbi:hypothetical protein CASFOL_017556 [Castilleja foliolosa]|uniref:Non-structural maintenance of chromosomes element 1 homolog n=1 Tax=Castilleja foliolosa TaxID=1961234 RepID=A0ABD3DBA9_9LAMI